MDFHEESRRAKCEARSVRRKEEKKARKAREDAERARMRVYWERRGPDAVGIYF